MFLSDVVVFTERLREATGYFQSDQSNDTTEDELNDCEIQVLRLALAVRTRRETKKRERQQKDGQT